jgi:hypothetical protein
MYCQYLSDPVYWFYVRIGFRRRGCPAHVSDAYGLQLPRTIIERSLAGRFLFATLQNTRAVSNAKSHIAALQRGRYVPLSGRYQGGGSGDAAEGRSGLLKQFQRYQTCIT